MVALVYCVEYHLIPILRYIDAEQEHFIEQLARVITAKISI